jgi:hypothetical protein
MWQKLKQKKPSLTNKVTLGHSVAIVVKTHFEKDIAIIKVDNQMAIIQIQVENTFVEDVLLDGGTSVNIIT